LLCRDRDIESVRSPNQITAPNCRPALQFRCAGFFGRCIRWQRPFPAAVGEFHRSAEERRHDDTLCIRNGLVVAGGV
jgi:hypothetical protein